MTLKSIRKAMSSVQLECLVSTGDSSGLSEGDNNED